MAELTQTGVKRPHGTEDDDCDDIDENELLGGDSDEEDDSGNGVADLLLEKLNLSDEEDVADKTEGPGEDIGLNLRGYQMELASNALRGVNTVVYAATGAGKTRVALFIVKQHLEKNPKGKVLITAEKTFLVGQHERSLRKLLPEYDTRAFRVEQGSGDDLHLLFDNYSIFLLTPALIENSKKQDPDFLSKFSLLILDECHHTKGDSPYNRLMVWYHFLKEEGKSVPQIVGLTASFGTNRSNSIEKAKEHVLKVMASLDVVKISAVSEHGDNNQEYERFRRDVKNETHVLPKMQELDELHKQLVQAMVNTEDLMCSFTDLLEISDPEEKDLMLTFNKRESVTKGEEAYTTWLGDLENKAATLFGRRPEIAQSVNLATKYLKIYQDIITINHQTTADIAVDVLQKALQQESFGSFYEGIEQNEKDLANIAKDLQRQAAAFEDGHYRPTDKPIEKLLNQLNGMSESKARYIVLVKTRKVAEKLTTVLKREGYEVAVFTGSSASSDLGGTSRSEQETALMKFNEGKVDGLVATNILEEGLDIQACNSIIHYYYVGNEISTRQTAGRIRAKTGTRIVMSDAKDTDREYRNLKRSLLMDEAMKLLLQMSEKEITDFISKEQTAIKARQRQKRQKKDHDAKRPRLDNSKYKMVCMKCQKFEVNCNTLRCVNGQHHVIIDPSIWSQVALKPFPKKAPRFDTEIICQGMLFGAGIKGGSHSTKCTHELGTISKFRETTLPFLSYKMVRVIDTDTKTSFKLSKWSDAPFVIQTIESDDLEVMASCDPNSIQQ